MDLACLFSVDDWNSTLAVIVLCYSIAVCVLHCEVLTCSSCLYILLNMQFIFYALEY
jgi:hypothetical protein